MPHNCCVPKCFSNSKKDQDFKFHRFPMKEELKQQWIWKICRDEGQSFVVSDNTHVCSTHFSEEDYIVSEYGLDQKIVLKKNSVPSLFIWSKPTKSRKTKSSEGRRSEVPPVKNRRKCCSKCEAKQNTIDSLQNEVSTQDNRVKDLQDTIAKLQNKLDGLESERNDLQLQLLEKERHTCFGAELFKDDDQSI